MFKSALRRHAAAVAIILIIGLFGLLSFLTLRSVSTLGGIAFTTDVRGTAAPVSWIAYQDGDEPWQTVRVGGNRYRLPIRSGRFGLALVCHSEPLVRIIHTTRRELRTLQISFTGGLVEKVWPEIRAPTCSRWFDPLHTISGRAAGVRPGHSLHVVEDGIASLPRDEYEQRVSAGTRDVVLLEVPKEDAGPGGTELPARIVLVRDVVVDGEKRIATGISAANVPGSRKVDCSEASYFEPKCSGLPDYKRNSPFTSGNPKYHTALARRLASVTTAPKDCRVGTAWSVPQIGDEPLLSNICRPGDFAALRDLVSALAPRLQKGRLSLRKADLNGAGQSGLVVGYVDIRDDRYTKDPYLSLWWLENTHGRYVAVYGGSYLAGRVWAIQPFGPSSKVKRVFVRHQNCLACHPWIFLTILDFSHCPTARPFQFTYDPAHKKFGDTVEYELPGWGHSVDAETISGVPTAHAANTPHLIQHFRYLHEDKHEWLIFTCKGLICDYEMHNKQRIPAKFRKLWESGETL